MCIRDRPRPDRAGQRPATQRLLVRKPLSENRAVPELPEVQALVDFLRERTDGLAIVAVSLGSISVLKTYDPAPSSLHGLPISNVARHGKFIDIEAEGLHLVFHLARAGWLRWSDALSVTTIRARWKTRCSPSASM